MKFIKRLLGWECCGEWTQWESKKANFTRWADVQTDGYVALKTDKIEYTKRWQERRCTLCGRIQQRDLDQ